MHHGRSLGLDVRHDTPILVQDRFGSEDDLRFALLRMMMPLNTVRFSDPDGPVVLEPLMMKLVLVMLILLMYLDAGLRLTLVGHLREAGCASTKLRRTRARWRVDLDDFVVVGLIVVHALVDRPGVPRGRVCAMRWGRKDVRRWPRYVSVGVTGEVNHRPRAHWCPSATKAARVLRRHTVAVPDPAPDAIPLFEILNPARAGFEAIFSDLEFRSKPLSDLA